MGKHAFWQALIFTIVIFMIGLLIGFFIETSRTDKLSTNILESEISLLDAQTRNRGIEQFEVNCEISKESTINFANDVYYEALQLEQLESVSKFSESLKTLHKRYDLLRTLLWMEGIRFKKQCPEEIHTVVYIFEYDAKNVNKKAEQASTSRLLLDLKDKHEDKIILLPIAGNLNIKSVDLAMKEYKISDLPAIIVDEKIVIEGQTTMEELEDLIFKN